MKLGSHLCVITLADEFISSKLKKHDRGYDDYAQFDSFDIAPAVFGIRTLIWNTVTAICSHRPRSFTTIHVSFSIASV